MKHILLRGFAVLSCMFFIPSTYAQLDSCNVFLKGHSIEVGINTNGAYGSSIAPPRGYHPSGGVGTTANHCSSVPSSLGCAQGLGFVADPAKDGWTIGTPPFYGDYFLPGDPQEGWAVQINGVMAKAFNGGGYDGCGGIEYTPASSGLTGKNINYYSNGQKNFGVWQGKMDSVIITQTTIVDTSTVYFTVFVSMVNTGKVDRHNVFYLRTVDPDNDEPEPGGSFSTDNKIEYQLPNALNRTMVSATPTNTAHSIAFLGLGTLDCRAKCFIIHGSLSPDWGHLDTMYGQGGNPTNYVDSIHYQYSGVDTNDEGIGMVFKLNDIPAGDSITFAYAYVLRKADLDSAFESTRPHWQTPRDTLQHKSGDTIIVCTESYVPVNVVNGTGLKWHWDSPTGNKITDTSGLTSTIYVDTGVTIARAIGRSAACLSDTELIYLRAYAPPPPILINNSPLCLGDTLHLYALQISSGSTYIVTWHGPNNFTSNLAFPTIPNVQSNDSGVYYVADSVAGCPTTTTSTRVVIVPVIAKIKTATPDACLGAPLLVSFAGTAPDTSTQYTWTFDNATLLSGDPTYSSKGPYSVKWDSASTRIITLHVHNFRCNSSAIDTVNVIIPPPVYFSLPKDFCVKDTVTVKVADYSLVNYDSLEWSYGPGGYFVSGGTGNSIGTSYIAYNSPGSKVISLTINYSRCTALPYLDTVLVHDLPPASITSNGEASICDGDTVAFTANFANTFRYTWAPSHNYAGIGGQPNVGRIMIPHSGNIYLSVRDQFNCVGMDSLFVNSHSCCEVYVPDGFTPNGDGRNDVLRLLTVGHHKLKVFRILNRYGQTVFESNVESAGWDGRMSGVPQEMGVFFWYLSYDCNGKTIEKKGDVTLIR
ncbi:MAG: gliding motility-associated C-terminal domain-containing protein [Taibaiella sp.]|nr:gliding motility-associated C-terminal domain-containing protein [Taibaiella sp.]